MPEQLTDGVSLYCGDCLDVLRGFAENSIDAIVTDPPYHLQSITKRFAKTGRTDKTRSTSGPHQRTARGFMNKLWDGGDIAFRVETWEAMLRVLKPGAYLVAFSSTRTFGRMSVAIEDSGFVVHPFIAWIFGQGFPKAHQVHADEWEGWRYGTQSLKPAIEPIFVGQKPFERGLTGTQNVIKWGVGALNIDACRIRTDDKWSPSTRKPSDSIGTFKTSERTTEQNDKGRWPANVIHDGSPEVVEMFPETGPGQIGGCNDPKDSFGFHGGAKGKTEKGKVEKGGSAARFFYCAKADADSRAGSRHPTVKPVDLMQYLVRLVTPPGGLVLDPFAGSGTTGEAAMREGFRAALIEREPEYQEDIRRRMKLALCGSGERSREIVKARRLTDHDAGPLFGELL
jgi:site-specific DNA-methyltransferase (adenine-specific)